jgi:hypothetical protein
MAIGVGIEAQVGALGQHFAAARHRREPCGVVVCQLRIAEAVRKLAVERVRLATAALIDEQDVVIGA